MTDLTKFDNRIADQARMVRNLSTAYLCTNLEWQRLNAKANAVENSGIIVDSILSGIIGSVGVRGAKARSILNALAEKEQVAIQNLTEQDPNNDDPTLSLRLVIASGTREGYHLAMDSLSEFLTFDAR